MPQQRRQKASGTLTWPSAMPTHSGTASAAQLAAPRWNGRKPRRCKGRPPAGAAAPPDEPDEPDEPEDDELEELDELEGPPTGS